MSLKEIVEQFEKCNYECEGGPLTMNVAFIELKKMADAEVVLDGDPQCTILQEFLDIERHEGIHWKEASAEMIAQYVPQVHQERFLRCGKVGRTCKDTDCSSHRNQQTGDMEKPK